MTKGIYAKARRGEVTGFAGVDDPYEAPLHAEITLDTVNRTAEENARTILDYLLTRGFVQADEHDSDGFNQELLETAR
jgi:sulfate adenylyltransferase